MVEELNAAIREVFEEHGRTWNPRTGDGLWVEERDGQLMICDYHTAAPLSSAEATPEAVRRMAEEWIEATG